MLHRFSKTHRLLMVAALSSALVLPDPANAGSATGAATEWTQLANNAELIKLLESSSVQVENQLTQISQLAEQIQNQLKIYQNMLQNTAQLPNHIWGEVESDLKRLQSVVSQGQGIAFSMGNADDILKQRFPSYADLKTSLSDGTSFSSTYQSWSDTNRDTIAGSLNAASLTADQFETEESTMASLRSMSQSADGQMKALQVGHQIAAQQVAQMQKLRGLLSQQMTMMGTWLQAKPDRQGPGAEEKREVFRTRGKRNPRWTNDGAALVSPVAIIAFRVGTVGVATAAVLIMVDTHSHPASTTATAAEQRLRISLSR